MASALQRELSVWADFNSFDGERRITATLRFAKSPERPVEGELVRLYDSEGNTVMGVVERIEGMTLHVRPEMATWSSSDVSLHSPFAGETPFRAAPQGEPVT